MGFRLLGEEIHYRVYLVLCIIVAAAMPVSKAILSIAMILMILNFLLDGGLLRLKAIPKNNLVLALTLFFILHIIGLIWSSDVAEGLKDMKSKLPFIVFPIIIYCTPLKFFKHWKWILVGFILSLFLTSVYNFLSYYQLIGHKVYDDIRGMSLFASHIRYGLMIGMGAGITYYLAIQEKRFRIVYILLLVWFCIYTYFSEVLSGGIALISVFCAILFYHFYYYKKWSAFVFATIVFTSIIAVIYTILPIEKKELEFSKLEWYSPSGNPYIHHPLTYSEITGEPVIYYYCEEELKPAWEKVSAYPFDGNTDRGISVKFTLARYMAAKSLRKDKDGFKALNKNDIHNVEKGYFSFEESQGGLFNRIYSIRHQLLNNDNPNGHSLLQRLEYWKASWIAIQRGFIIGYGTGSNQKVLNSVYDKIDSPLYPENRHCSHNQFMSYTISHGIFGLLFLIIIFYLMIKQSLAHKDLVGFVSILALFTSFLFEDTLETQVGVSIFGLFIALSIAYQAILKLNKPSSN